jgi:hypothetical protein
MGVRTRRPDMLATWSTRAEEKAGREQARRVIERWNAALAADHGTPWSPTIRASLIAGMPWLDVHCPGCHRSRAVDIRTIDRHPLVLGLRCTWCGGAAPMPRIAGLHMMPPSIAGGEKTHA